MVSVTIGRTVVAVELERTVVRIRLVAIVGTDIEGDKERKRGRTLRDKPYVILVSYISLAAEGRAMKREVSPFTPSEPILRRRGEHRG